MAFGEQDRWGKRRPRAPKPWLDAAEFFATAVGKLAISDPPWQILGLDLIGPGGGQWTLTLRGDQLLAADRGLAAECEEVYTLPTQVLAAIAGENDRIPARELFAALR
jgi:hypothetical protein